MTMNTELKLAELRKSRDARDKAYEAYSKARAACGKARNKVQEAYQKACAACGKARAVYDKAYEAYSKALEAL